MGAAYRGNFFIKRDFAFFDCGLLALMNAITLHVYEVIRRFVQRSEKIASAETRALRDDGKVVAFVSQSTVAEYLGVSRETVNRHIKQLKDLGWIQVVWASNQDTPSNYILGDTLLDSQGLKHETYFTDAWLAALLEEQEKEASKRTGNPEASVMDLSMEQRLEITRRALGQMPEPGRVSKSPTTEVSTRVRTGSQDPVTPASHGGCDSSVTGGVIPASQGVCLHNHTEVEKSEVEKSEVENLCARSARTEKFPEIPKGYHPPGPPEEKEEETPTADVDPATSALTSADMDRFVKEAVARTQAAQRKRGEEKLSQVRTDEQRQANLKGKVTSISSKQQIRKFEEAWMEGVRAKWPNITFATWGPKEVGMCKLLLERYSGDTIKQALHYLVEQWDTINSRFFKNQGGFPTLRLLSKLHDSLIPESQRWSELKAISERYHRWIRSHPNDLNLPEDLEAQYQAARKEMASLGIA
jgi:DNA-binding Lrp family transcriptional regulator